MQELGIDNVCDLEGGFSAWKSAGGDVADAIHAGRFPKSPKTIDFTIDYLRSGRARDAYARAEVQKAGRRVANVRVEAWQDARDRPIAAAHGHFLMPDAD